MSVVVDYTVHLRQDWMVAIISLILSWVRADVKDSARSASSLMLAPRRILNAHVAPPSAIARST